MGARWYNAANGDFGNKDTVSNNPVPNSASASPYAYAADNPLGDTDPTGHLILVPGSLLKVAPVAAPVPEPSATPAPTPAAAAAPKPAPAPTSKSSVTYVPHNNGFSIKNFLGGAVSNIAGFVQSGICPDGTGAGSGCEGLEKAGLTPNQLDQNLNNALGVDPSSPSFTAGSAAVAIGSLFIPGAEEDGGVLGLDDLVGGIKNVVSHLIDSGDEDHLPPPDSDPINAKSPAQSKADPVASGKDASPSSGDGSTSHPQETHTSPGDGSASHPQETHTSPGDGSASHPQSTDTSSGSGHPSSAEEPAPHAGSGGAPAEADPAAPRPAAEESTPSGAAAETASPAQSPAAGKAASGGTAEDPLHVALARQGAPTTYQIRDITIKGFNEQWLETFANKVGGITYRNERLASLNLRAIKDPDVFARTLIDHVVEANGRISFSLNNVDQAAAMAGEGAKFTGAEFRYIINNPAARAITTFYDGPLLF